MPKISLLCWLFLLFSAADLGIRVWPFVRPLTAQFKARQFQLATLVLVTVVTGAVVFRAAYILQL